MFLAKQCTIASNSKTQTNQQKFKQTINPVINFYMKVQGKCLTHSNTAEERSCCRSQEHCCTALSLDYPRHRMSRRWVSYRIDPFHSSDNKLKRGSKTERRKKKESSESLYVSGMRHTTCKQSIYLTHVCIHVYSSYFLIYFLSPYCVSPNKDSAKRLFLSFKQWKRRFHHACTSHSNRK
jgi:hypothetical protein